jgi:hypothetical protein
VNAYSAFIKRLVVCSGFFMGFDAMFGIAGQESGLSRAFPMAFAADYMVLFDRLDEELRIAPQLDRSLFTKIIVGACKRIPVLSKSAKAVRIDRLIEAGAWTDAALAVVALELPDWQLRRLEYDGGQWFCALSRGPNLPAMLDDTADANHELMPLAILRAFFQARRMTEIAPRATSPVPQVSAGTSNAICCDNFA